jgi:hypothetical protein
MELEIASPEHASQLAEFYKSFLTSGLVDLKVDRNDNFFGPYDIQSDTHITYMLKEAGQLEGTASFVMRDVLLDGRPQSVAFGRDLRISNNRKVILEWSKHFLPVMQEVGRTLGTQYFFSIMSMSDAQALNAFVRPRTMKRPLPRYYLFRRFNMVSLHGRLPWAKNPLPHMRIRKGSPAHLDALIYYISQKSRERELSTVWDTNSFTEKLDRWKGLKLEDFLIAFDAQDNIVGCVAPWAASGVQDFIPMQYSLRAHNFRQFLKFGKSFGWTRTLTKPFSRVKIEGTLNFKYLNFLFADHEDVFSALLWKAYDDAEENEFLMYSQPRSDIMFRSPLSWISSKMPFGVYLLLPPDQTTPSFLHPKNEKTLEIEPFFAL